MFGIRSECSALTATNGQQYGILHARSHETNRPKYGIGAYVLRRKSPQAGAEGILPWMCCRAVSSLVRIIRADGPNGGETDDDRERALPYWDLDTLEGKELQWSRLPFVA